MDKIVTMKQQVYNALKRKIADGTYIHGQHLQEKELAEKFEISRSPVREALKQLVMEEILVEVPNKGIFIKDFTEKEITDMYTTKTLIECYAIDFLEENEGYFPKEKLLKIKANIEKLTWEEIDYLVEPDINPHFVIVEATQNDYLIKLHHRADFCTASYHSALFAEDNYKINIQQHLDIVNTLLSKEFAKAKEYLKSHLKNSQEVICKAIKNGELCKI